LKGRIPKKPKKVIKIDLVTAGKLTRVIDEGLGMSTEELEAKFGTSAPLVSRA